jgi:hypothetical protein
MSVETNSTTLHKHKKSHLMNVFISISLYYILLGGGGRGDDRIV